MRKKYYITTKGHLYWSEKLQQYKYISDEGYWYEGPLALATTPPTLEVTDWAFYNDGTESGSTIIGTKNTNPTLLTDTIYQFRTGLEETSGNSGKNQTPQLQYNLNSGGWVNVTGSSSVVQAAPSTNLTDGNDTTQRLTTFTYDTTNEGVDDADGLAGGNTADILSDGFEALFSFKIISTDVVNADTIQLKIVNGADGDVDYDVYNQTDAVITVSEVTAPVIYNRTLNSNFDINDPQSRYADKIRNLLSNMDISDLLIRIKLVEVIRNFSESLDLTDGDLQHYLTSNYTINNDVSINDVIIRTLETTGAIYNRTLINGVDVSDFIISEIYQDINRILQSNVDISDNILSQIIVEIVRILSSNIDANDLLITYKNKLRTLNSDINITDLIISNAFYIYSVILAENIDLIDSINIEALVNRLLQSSLDISDGIVKEISANVIARILSNSITTTDGDLSRNVFNNYFIENNIDINDFIIRTISIIGNISRILNDSINVEDFLIRNIDIFGAIFRTLNDAVTTDDFISSILTINNLVSRALQDSLNVYDITLSSRIAELIISEYVSASDTINKYAELNRLLESNTTINDIISILNQSWIVLNRLLTDDLNTNDINYISILKIRLLDASVDIVDFIKNSNKFSRLLNDSALINDLINSVITPYLTTYVRILADSINLSDDAVNEIVQLLISRIVYGLEDLPIEMDLEESINITMNTEKL